MPLSDEARNIILERLGRLSDDLHRAARLGESKSTKPEFFISAYGAMPAALREAADWVHEQRTKVREGRLT